jgi:hypothetical protein
MLQSNWLKLPPGTPEPEAFATPAPLGSAFQAWNGGGPRIKSESPNEEDIVYLHRYYLEMPTF